MKKAYIFALFYFLLFISLPLYSQIVSETKESKRTTTRTNNQTNERPRSDAGKTLIKEISEENEKMRSGYAGFLFRAFITVIIFVGALYLIFRFIKKRSVNMGLSPTDTIRVLGMTPIAPNRYIALVEIAEHIYALGIGDNNISFLTEITDAEAIKSILIKASEESASSNEMNFKDMFDGLLKGFNIKPKEKSAFDAMEDIKTRIDKMNNKDESPDND